MTIDRQIEVLELVNSYIKPDDFFRRGICDILYHLSAIDEIDDFEYAFMLRLIKNNKPTPDNQFSEFINSKFWINSNYWWDTMYMTETRIIRKDYLNKLIATLK